MAAGLGSRFGGGIKQLARLGPDREIIMEYSIYDAIRAGFNEVVFILRKEIETDFREIIGNRIERVIPCRYVFQELDKLPEGFTVPEGRTKPWGTAHALMMARPVLDSSFAVINADDYYGPAGFRLLHQYMTEEMDEKRKVYDLCMAGYHINNTLSDNGTVNRGICEVKEGNLLSSIKETYEIRKTASGIAGEDSEGRPVSIPENALVSMNLFGLPLSYLDVLIEEFPHWLKEHGQERKSEYLLPKEVDRLMQAGELQVKLLEDPDRWFGVTYQEDADMVKKSLQKLTEEGVYPRTLFPL